MENIPEWLGAGVLTAALAAVGYVLKTIIQAWLDWREAHRTAREERVARLVGLKSLLDTGKVSFNVQVRHANDLYDVLRRSQAISHDLLEGAEGFDDSFARAYDEFTPDQKELHEVIRSITMSALRPTNQALLEWLRQDTFLRAQWRDQGVLGDLAKSLAELEVHLILWLAKYDMWIPDDPRHALVFLNDEKQHGVRFPNEIDDYVRKALELKTLGSSSKSAAPQGGKL
ncbi:MAG: hypothetical protein K8J31_27805 [Anaerolineae bacterium]|nr:hypothetical protein [Anaerolineae bacterium]